MRNLLKLCDEYIQLYGFSKIDNEATFALYDGGVAITAKREKDREYYYNVNINKERIIEDKALVELLKNERNYSNEVSFFYSGDSYLEIYPTKKKE